MDIDELLTTTRSARKSLDLSAPADLDDIRDCLRIGLQAANGIQSAVVALGDRHRSGCCATRSRTCTATAYLDKVGGQLIAGFMPRGPRRPVDVIHRVARGEHGEGSCAGDSVLRTHDAESRRRRILLSGNALRVHLSRRVEFPARTAYPWIRNLHHDAAPAPRERGARTARNPRVVRAGLPAAGRRDCEAVTRSAAAPRRAIDEVVGINGWDGR